MKKSTLLKVMSIIAIVFGIIAIIMTFATLGQLAMFGDIFSALALLGYNVGLYVFTLVIEIIFSILLLVAGIFGLASKNIKGITTMGLILIVLKVVDIILCIVVGAFSAMLLIGFIIPILYYIGAKTSAQ